MKRNELVTSSLSESISIGYSKIHLSFWTEPAGITEAALVICAGLSIVCQLYLLYKMRMLSMAMVILSNKAVQGKTLDYFKGRDELGLDQGEMDSLRDFHVKNLQTVSSHSPSTTIAVVIVIGMLIVVYRVYKKMCGNKAIDQFHFFLEFNNKNICQLVKLGSFEFASEDLKISSEEFIKNVRIEGYWRPILHFECKGLGLQGFGTNFR